MRQIVIVGVVGLGAGLAACGGDDGARHIVDGAGSGSATTPLGGVTFAISSGNSVYATAYFSTSAQSAGLPPQCTQVVAAGCSLTLCSSPITGTASYAPAGTITAVGGVPATTYTLVADAMNAYSYGPTDSTAVFTDGDTVTIAGTGATVPAFSQVLTIPTLAQVTAPPTSGTVPRANDLAVSWTGGNRLDTELFELFKTTPYELLACSVTDHANAGQLVMPSTLLEMMTPGATMMIGAGYAVTSTMVGNLPTEFVIGGDLRATANDVYVGRLTLQ